MVEFGAGDGSPVISCLLKAPYTGTVHAFELNPAAAGLARSRAHQFGIGHKYQVSGWDVVSIGCVGVVYVKMVRGVMQRYRAGVHKSSGLL
jgi:hypothetical protein